MMNMYDVFVESLNKLNLGDVKTKAIKTICNTLLESNLSGNESNTEYNDNDKVDYNIIKKLDNGYSIVEDYATYNVIDTDGNLLYSKWFDALYDYVNGFAKCHSSKGYNFIDRNGNILCDNMWFRDAYDFHEDAAVVLLYGNDLARMNYVKSDGTLLSYKCFNICNHFNHGCGVVCSSGKFNVIDINGNLLCDKEYDDISTYNDYGTAEVKDGGRYNFIDVHGKVLFDTWFDSVEYPDDEYPIVESNYKYTYILHDGHFVSDIWYDECHRFSDVGAVCLNDKWNYVKPNGRLLSKQWFNYCQDFMYGVGEVEAVIKKNVMNPDGSISSIKKNKYNFININGHIISDIWFDWCGDWNIETNSAQVKLQRKFNRIDKNGNLLNAWE